MQGCWDSGLCKVAPKQDIRRSVLKLADVALEAVQVGDELGVALGVEGLLLQCVILPSVRQESGLVMNGSEFGSDEQISFAWGSAFTTLIFWRF